jgi:protein O-GlcNAc transferase
MLSWLRRGNTAGPELAAALKRGFAALNAGDLDAARTALDSVLAVNPHHPDGNYLMGLALLRGGDLKSALARLDAAIAADGTNAAFRFSRAECLRPLGRIQEAAEAFESALALDGDDANWWHELGSTRQALGQREAAMEAYRQALARDAGLVPALCNLGALLAEAGQHDAARETYREAMARAPHSPAGALGLGGLLQADGDMDGAEGCYRAVLATAPDEPEALVNLGSLLFARKELAEAEVVLRHALEVRPDSAAAWINLGVVLRGAGRSDEALEAHARAAQLAPQLPAALLQHALSLRLAGDLPAAEARLHEACALAPDNPEVHATLAAVLMAQGAIEEAEAEFLRCLELRPSFAGVWADYAVLLINTGRGEAAAAALEHALKADPELPEAHLLHGMVHLRLHRFPESEKSLKRALELNPDLLQAQIGLQVLDHLTFELSASEAACRRTLSRHPDAGDAWLNLGNALLVQGRLDEALAATRRAVEILPDPRQAWSNTLLTLNYRSESTPQVLIEEHRRYGNAYPPRRDRHAFTRNRDPQRRLRVGYLSPDFRKHVVAFFIEPVIEAHDPRAVEVVGYYNDTQVDEVTRRIRDRAVFWREVANLDDDRLESLMLEDQLDILVDLGGHTARTRLPAASRRVAPIQASWLGYPNTTGLKAFDWRITDDRADPAPDAEAQYVERLWRLPETFLTYRPPPEAPGVMPLPLQERGFVTFGAFNNFSKVTDLVLELWARILREAPGSRLQIKTGALKDEEVRERALRRLTALGVEPARVQLSGVVPGRVEHLTTIAGLDLQLDTFPYHGTTTTCESLWMGVPVVSLAGDRHASRVGVSLLEAVGAGDLVAHDPDGYVALAVSLAKDPARLADLRTRLRPAMQRSPLTDATRFTRHLESAYRGMWHDWLSETA